MQDLPHHYIVVASAAPQGEVKIDADAVETIFSAPPAEFGGPGNRWSPESLLVASVADCFILTFRAISRASKLDWISLQCDANGTLDKADGATRFTRFDIRATLEVSSDASVDKARQVLEKAEQNCLITNSLSATTHLDADVIIK
jgi:peroxiredoxin-like protein